MGTNIPKNCGGSNRRYRKRKNWKQAKPDIRWSEVKVYYVDLVELGRHASLRG